VEGGPPHLREEEGRACLMGVKDSEVLNRVLKNPRRGMSFPDR